VGNNPFREIDPENFSKRVGGTGCEIVIARSSGGEASGGRRREEEEEALIPTPLLWMAH
jgi:hypothetical protein